MGNKCRTGFSRRSFLKGAAIGMAGAAFAAEAFSLMPEESHPTENKVNPILIPALKNTSELVPALARRFPWVWNSERKVSDLQIANAMDPANQFNQERSKGLLGLREFRSKGDTLNIPWAPMFERRNSLLSASTETRRLTGIENLFVMDEGSNSIAICGNKIRKYEFTLPNLYHCGVRKIFSHGAYGSNHCAQLALATKFSKVAVDQAVIDLTLSVYPQVPSDDVVTKLHLLQDLGVNLKFLPNMLATGLSMGIEQTINNTNAQNAEGFIDPGGSSSLSTLGHVDAAVELAEMIQSKAYGLQKAPDFVFLPLGSGATAVGLILGFYILGWDTKVVVTCSQDKDPLTRLIVNGSASEPFAIGHAKQLLSQSLVWLRKLGLISREATADDIIKKHLSYDNESWLPAYGEVAPGVRDEMSKARELGLVLDSTFSGKSYHTMLQYARSGLLKNKNVVFWNTYQRFDYSTLIVSGSEWKSSLPEDIKRKLVGYGD